MKYMKIANATVLVDDDVYEWAKHYKWSLSAIKYPCNSKLGYLHRIVANTPDGLVTDHINRDTLDCRRENLRVTTRRLNICNSPRRPNGSNPLKGAYLKKSSGRWRSQISVNRKIIYLGIFPTPELAHAAYILAARRYFGEMAHA